MLSVPVDLPLADAPDVPPPLPLAAPIAPGPAPDALAELADLLAEAERPLPPGRPRRRGVAGARVPRSRRSAPASARRSRPPRWRTASSPACRSTWGSAGGFASPHLAEVAAASDAVVAFGASLNRWTVRHGALLHPAARIAVVDVDPAAPGRLHRCDVAVVGDAALTASAAEAELGARSVARPGRRRPADAAAIAARRWRDEPYADTTGADGIDPRTLTIRLDDLLPAERTVVVDSGHFMGYPAMYLARPGRPRASSSPRPIQAVGLGLAHGDRRRARAAPTASPSPRSATAAR